MTRSPTVRLQAVRFPAALLVSILLLAACGAGTPPPAMSVQRDSAGVSIVESATQPGAPATLALSDEPLLQIGVLDGAAEYQLHRVQALVRLSDGTLVVANSGSRELRFYSSDGRHLRSVGGAGSGPGEFRALTHVSRLAGDSLLVFDALNRRTTIFDGGGRHVRDWSAMQDGRTMRVVGALPDGTLLTTNSARSAPGRTVEYSRDTVTYEITRHGAGIPIERRYAGSETRFEVQERGGSIVSFSVMTLPFSRSVMATTAGAAFVIGSSDSYELHVYSADGALRRIIRRTDVVPQPVTAELVQLRVDDHLARRRAAGDKVSAEDAAAARRQALAYHRVETVPAFTAITGAADGGLWVKTFVPPGADGTAGSWAVHDVAGHLIGTILLPADFQPMFIEGDVVAGVIRDEFDVEYVRVYSVSPVPLR
jgi:hypothetical protein